MSMTVDGVWKAGVWAPTAWADGVWYEGVAVSEPTPTPATVPVVRAGAGHSVQDILWYDDKPWIRRRDRDIAKVMREAVEGDDEERKRKQRRRSEAIAVAIMMLR